MDYYERKLKRMAKSYRACFWSFIGVAVMLLILLLSGCRQTEYIPLEQTHTEHHWHTDSVKQVDSIFSEKETVIMQLDSQQMALYGIQLKAAERAWLVKSRELERQIQQLKQLSQSKDTVRDSIPVPYPVPARLTSWQQFKVNACGRLILITILLLIYIVVRIVRTRQL